MSLRARRFRLSINLTQTSWVMSQSTRSAQADQLHPAIALDDRGRHPPAWMSRPQRRECPDPGRRWTENAATPFTPAVAADAVVADIDTGVYVDTSRISTVEHRGPRFNARGRPTVAVSRSRYNGSTASTPSAGSTGFTTSRRSPAD